ncbi:MAG TPA: SdrD B-like domain-containing protein [Anaerolineales bacterium]
MRVALFGLLCALLALGACQPARSTLTPSIATHAPTDAPSPAAEPSMPPDMNPLTGERVADPALLKIPALLVSITNFPASARPQAGLSFAPFVYEFYITEGATRFLAVFYGEFPHPESPITGGCETRSGPFVQSATLLGNRVWLDANANGLQDPGERGVGGICVSLYDAGGSLLQRASTDSNGYYGFNIHPGRYTVQFSRPHGYEFTSQDAGNEMQDSDADPVSGRASVDVSVDDLSVDAGLLPTAAAPTPDPGALPLAQVGPVRSGRLVYSYVAGYFRNSCLIYAFASEEVLKRLPQCHMVFHQLAAGGYMMGLDEMQSVAQENLKAKGSDFDYRSNTYSEMPPSHGEEAGLLKVYFAYQNQSGWAYDPASQSYLRYVDTSEFDQAGVLHSDTDRLTGRQLSVQNVIILYATHEVVSPTNLDIHLDPGRTGQAVLLRNGEMYQIKWSTMPESSRGSQVHPIQFLAAGGDPVSLEPGHTWVIVVTPDSKLEETKPGQWQLTFAQPPGAK